MPPQATAVEADYRALAEFRYLVRRFVRFSEEAARAAGVEPQQHQLLLAVKGMPQGRVATIGELAERLQLRQHSLAELVDRAEEHGLVRRSRGEHDRRQVLVELTSAGERLLRELSLHHHEQLRQAGPELIRTLTAVMRSIGPRRISIDRAGTSAEQATR